MCWVTSNRASTNGWTGADYGRFNFVREKILKWITVFRLPPCISHEVLRRNLLKNGG